MSDADLLQRLYDFTLDLDIQAVDRADRYDWGRALLTPGLTDIWSANYLLFDDTEPGAERMAEIAELVMGQEGLEHRKVMLAGATDGATLAGDFDKLGWTADNYLFMVLRREPDRPAADGIVVERRKRPDKLERQALMDDEFLQRESTDLERTVQGLLEWEIRLGNAGGDDWFVAGPEGGEPGSLCALFNNSEFAQVENVATVAAARNQGLARAAVLGACEAGRAEGKTVFVVADADDWPRAFYERLGFDELGTVATFRKSP